MQLINKWLGLIKGEKNYKDNKDFLVEVYKNKLINESSDSYSFVELIKKEWEVDEKDLSLKQKILVIDSYLRINHNFHCSDITDLFSNWLLLTPWKKRNFLKIKLL